MRVSVTVSHIGKAYNESMLRQDQAVKDAPRRSNMKISGCAETPLAPYHMRKLHKRAQPQGGSRFSFRDQPATCNSTLL